MMYMMEDFLKWLDENRYLSKDDDLNYEIIIEQYLHFNIIDKIKNIFDLHYHIPNTIVWYDEWENTYKCTFTTNLIRDIDTETLNNKLNDIKMNIINVRLTKKQQNPYSLSTTSFHISVDKYEYVFEIAEIKYDGDL